MDRIIRMVMNVLIRRLVVKGIDAGVDAFSKRRIKNRKEQGQEDNLTPEDRAEMKRNRQAVKRARQVAKMGRRMGRM